MVSQLETELTTEPVRGDVRPVLSDQESHTATLDSVHTFQNNLRTFHFLIIFLFILGDEICN